MNAFFEGFRNFIKKNFLPPRRMNWSYPLFLMSIGMLITVILKSGISQVLPFTPTSLAFCSLVVPFLTLLALVIPAISLSSNNEELTLRGISGSFTGIGPLFIALFSGVPLSLLYSSLHNLSAYLWLRLGGSVVFPTFMCYNQDDSVMGKILEIVTQSVIPALGICIFFTGLMWSVFKDQNKLIGSVIIVLSFVLYSLNVIDIPGTAIMGIWMILLRKKTDNIYAPFLAMVAMKITEMLFTPILSQVDITKLQTYSDISVTYFYASVPALFVSAILFSFFKASLDDFERVYYSDLLGREAENDPDADKGVAAIIKGFSPALLITLAILVILWANIFRK